MSEVKKPRCRAYRDYADGEKPCVMHPDSKYMIDDPTTTNCRIYGNKRKCDGRGNLIFGAGTKRPYRRLRINE